MYSSILINDNKFRIIISDMYEMSAYTEMCCKYFTKHLIKYSNNYNYY